MPSAAQDGEYPPVLCYHQVVEHKSRLEPGMPVILASDLEAQLRYLAKHHTRTLTMAGYVDVIGKPDPPRDAVLLTFDDGYESVYTIIYPLLQKYNMHATAFVITSRLDQENVVNPHQPWLTTEQCREMKASGLLDVQGHAEDSHQSVLGLRNKVARSGPYLTTRIYDPRTDELETEEAYNARVLKELRTVRERLDQGLEQSTVAFCWPYGATNAETALAAREAGYLITFGLEAKSPRMDGVRYRYRIPAEWDAVTKALIPGPGPVASADVGQQGHDEAEAPVAPSEVTSPVFVPAPSPEPSAEPSPKPALRLSALLPLPDTLGGRVLAGVLSVLVAAAMWTLCCYVFFRPSAGDAGKSSPR